MKMFVLDYKQTSYVYCQHIYNLFVRLTQQSASRHVAPFGHIILIQSQPGFDVTP